MKITRTSLVSNVKRTKELDVTQKQIDSWKNGKPIQEAMPNLTAAEREFIKTGITDKEWEELE